MNDIGTNFVVVLLSDPAGLESGERGQSGCTLPDGELAIGGGDDSDLGAGGGLSQDLGLQAVGKALIHGGTTGDDDGLAELSTDVDVGLLDGLPGQVLERVAGEAVERGREEQLGDHDTGGTWDGDHTLVGHRVLRVTLAGSTGGLLLGSIVLSDVTKFFLDILDNFHLGGRCEVVTVGLQASGGPLSDGATSDFHLLDGGVDGESFEDGDCVRDAIAGVDDETGRAAVGVQGHDGLDGDVGFWEVEFLEEALNHLLSVLLRVSGGLSHKTANAFSGLDSELVEESVMPHLLHVFPVVDDAVRDGVLEVKDTSLLLGLISDVEIFLADALHSTGMLGTTDDGGENH